MTQVSSLWILLALVGLLVLWLVPKWQVRKLSSLKDRIESGTEARKTIAQVMGGIAILAGLRFTWQSLEYTRTSQDIARFGTAITILGEKDDEVRSLAAVFTLRELANRPEADRKAIGKILASFIRRRSLECDKYERRDWNAAQERRGECTSVQVALGALMVLGGSGAQLRGINLNHTEITNGDLGAAHLEGARLEAAQLTNVSLNSAFLSGASLQRARLQDCDLERVSLWNADLIGTVLRNSNLKWANLWASRLQQADLSGADLEGALLIGAQLDNAELKGASLRGAALDLASFNGAQMERATLDGAVLMATDLRGANLKGVIGLKPEQLCLAETDAKTILPAGISKPASCPQEILTRLRREAEVGLVMPILLKDTMIMPHRPSYKSDDGKARKVILQGVIAQDGTVEGLSVIPPETKITAFQKAAIEAVGRWRYVPAKRNGEPVDYVFTWFIEFEQRSRR